MGRNSGQRTQELRCMNTTAFSQDDYQRTVSGTLRRVFGPLRNASKIVARMTGSSPRTVENWFAGTCAPRGFELIKLMAECAELRAEVDRLIDQLQGNA